MQKGNKLFLVFKFFNDRNLLESKVDKCKVTIISGKLYLHFYV